MTVATPKAWRVLREFSTNVDEGSNQFWSFDVGQVIEDPETIRHLLSQNVPVADAEDGVTTICPACDRTFDSSKAESDHAVVIREKKTGVTYNDQFFGFRLGDVVTEPSLVAEVKRVGIPHSDTHSIKCPFCACVFYN